MDMGMNGSVDYDELMAVFYVIKKPSDPFNGLFEILAQKLKALEFDIE